MCIRDGLSVLPPAGIAASAPQVEPDADHYAARIHEHRANPEVLREGIIGSDGSVSYTHLTLPTSDLV